MENKPEEAQKEEKKEEASSKESAKDHEKEQKVREVLTKWLKLQKIIKEEITLEQIISKQEEDYKNSFKSSYFAYYSSKLKTRETSENLINIDNETCNLLNYSLVSNVEKCLGDAYDPTKKLLFLFRNNYDYVLKLVGLLDNIEENQSEINTLIELFCDQFYDNILIPNPDQEELLILCYLLLEREISSMNSASLSSFIDETQSFVGKFLKRYTRRQELKSYLSMTLGSLILSIENMGESCLDLNPTRIKAHLKSKQADKKCRILPDFTSYLTKEIPKCKINIHKNITLKEYSVANETDGNLSDDDNTPCEEGSSERRKDMKDEIILTYEDDAEEPKEEKTVNEDYSIEINQEELNDRIQKETDKDLREFYTRQLERINKDPDIFTNKKFQNSLEEFGEDKIAILINYKENFLTVRDKIDTIIQSLIDKITTIPYTLRCICKIIHMLILKKFDKINTYERNAFIGEFIFGKCILPILINSDTNAIITTTILSNNTRQCLKVIAKVLTKINRGYLFEANIDTDFTIFNHYIIEVIPLINAFYNKLIDIKLPHVLNELVEKHMKEPVVSQRTYIRDSKRKKDPKPTTPKEPTVTYNYFKENPEESMNIQCICFSIEDIILLIRKIKPRISEFSGLPQYNFFEKTIDRIANEEHKMDQAKKNTESIRQFFLVTKEEENGEFSFKKEDQKYILTDNNEDSSLFLSGMKFCIKNVLKGLNLINNKDYSYLNLADSTNNLFLALNATLDDIEEDWQFSNEIPLKWYAQYIANNKKMLSNEYRKNDFKMLYDEMLKEEENNLEKLKNINSIVMTRKGMNLRCSEKINEKAEREKRKMLQIESFMKMEKFINKAKIPVCISIRKPGDLKKSKTEKGVFGIFSKKTKDSSKEEQKEMSTISILSGEDCIHEKLSNISRQTGGRGDIFVDDYHPDSIKDFIKKLSKFPQVKEDVISGKQENKIYYCIEAYLRIVKKKIEEDKKTFGQDCSSQEITDILERIENHIMKKLYYSVFPKDPLPKDIEFHKKTCSLSWIKPSHLQIKNIYVNELKFAGDCVRKIDEGKSLFEKLNCIAAAHQTINNTIKFSSGKDTEAGADDLSPLFQYIIIQARPKRFYSNIQYIRAFLNPSKFKGLQGFLLTQMEFAAEFILKINHESLKMTEDDYNAEVTKALSKYNQKN